MFSQIACDFPLRRKREYKMDRETDIRPILQHSYKWRKHSPDPRHLPRGILGTANYEIIITSVIKLMIGVRRCQLASTYLSYLPTPNSNNRNQITVGSTQWTLYSFFLLLPSKTHINIYKIQFRMSFYFLVSIANNIDLPSRQDRPSHFAIFM